jgi:hypothetical protein
LAVDREIFEVPESGTERGGRDDGTGARERVGRRLAIRLTQGAAFDPEVDGVKGPADDWFGANAGGGKEFAEAVGLCLVGYAAR